MSTPANTADDAGVNVRVPVDPDAESCSVAPSIVKPPTVASYASVIDPGGVTDPPAAAPPPGLTCPTRNASLEAGEIADSTHDVDAVPVVLPATSIGVVVSAPDST